MTADRRITIRRLGRWPILSYSPGSSSIASILKPKYQSIGSSASNSPQYVNIVDLTELGPANVAAVVIYSICCCWGGRYFTTKGSNRSLDSKTYQGVFTRTRRNCLLLLFLWLSLTFSDFLFLSCWQTEEQEFITKLQKLSVRPQEDWGIALDFISPLCWQNAIFELSSLNHLQTPSMKLLGLSRCVKAIMSEFKLAALPRLSLQGKQSVYFRGRWFSSHISLCILSLWI